MRFPWANTALLTLLAAQLVTGYFGLVAGQSSRAWVLWVHGIGGYAILLLLVWKSAVVFRSYARRRKRVNVSRVSFAALTLLLLAVLATGLLWTFAGRRYWLGFSLITVHILLALGLAGLLAWHTLYMRFIFIVPEASSRRAFLRLSALAAAGVLFWRFTGVARAALSLPGARRRFTGSYETGSFTGDFPAVSWLLDNPPRADPQTWRLVIEGEVERPQILSYDEVQGLASNSTSALIDCTGGWYSEQTWSGVSAARMLGLAGVLDTARSVTFESATGYSRRFSLEQAGSYLLATHVAGGPLTHSHGFPLRLVAPGQRGFQWVKWVARIRVNDTPEFWQPPLPVQ